ncbi:hypothetical protein CMO89_04755 [Candidatus Woesearchaeota archaeon]|jgi:hypothetical protein|nr:hypothetical protein [Candidatus Woesearchaeota archaeon]|tara:strand:- start:9729 stop:10109 length:381 start_codon:yes stop_codon:yes gene_type:complete
MKKSQVSIEFIFALGTILFIFLIILGFMFNRSKDLSDSKTELDKRSTCLLISSLITSAFANGEGTIINISIDYNVSISTSDLNTDYKELGVEGIYCQSINPVQTANLRKGKIRIRNINNYINIQNV